MRSMAMQDMAQKNGAAQGKQAERSALINHI